MSSIGFGNSLGLQLANLLGRQTEEYGRVAERLSSGQRILSAADDPAGLALSAGLNVRARVAAQGVRNLNDGISMLNIASEALNALQSVNSRLKELAGQAQATTLSSTQRDALQSEVDSLVEEFNRIVSITTYNDIKLLDSSRPVVTLQASTGVTGAVDALLPTGTGTSTVTTTITANVAATSGFGDGTFKAPVSFLVGSDPGFGKLADLNNDGNLDIVTSNVASESLSVRLGNGNGTFAAQVCYDTGLDPLDHQLIDVTGDGNLDIVVVNGSDNSFSVLVGNGNGSFKAQVSFVTGTSPYFSSASDLNGDGFQDIVIGNYLQSSVGVYLGNGNGSFKAQVSYTTGPGPVGINIADVNEDGFLDLISGNEFTGNLSVLLGNGNGSFKAQTCTGTFDSPYDVLAQDFNGDGNLDLVTLDTGPGTTDVLYVQLGNGNGTWLAQVSYNLGLNVDYAFMGSSDFDGDGNADIAFTFDTINKIGFMFGNSDGSFSAVVTYATPLTAGIWDLDTGDINGDGITDLLVAGSNAENVALVYFGNGTPAAPASTTSYSTSLTIYDSLYLAEIDISTTQLAAEAAATLEFMNETISNGVSRVGASLSRLTFSVSNALNERLNAEESLSRVTSIDVAAEIGNATAAAIRKDATAALLAQANQEASRVISLLNFSIS